MAQQQDTLTVTVRISQEDSLSRRIALKTEITEARRAFDGDVAVRPDEVRTLRLRNHSCAASCVGARALH